jgi:hypothetical protein
LSLERLEDRSLLAVFNPVPGAADGASGSLRAAISQANVNGEDDTINLQAGTYNITLAGAGEDANATGDFDLTEAGHSVRIVGAGAGATVIDAHSLDRIFHLHSSVTMVLSGVTITGGREPVGAGIHNEGNMLTVTACTFTSNNADNGAGAIANNFGTLTVTDSTFTSNTAGDGAGAIGCGNGTVTITNSTFTNNSSPYGGALYIAGINVVISGSSFVGNTAGQGGGIYNYRGNLQLSNSVFQNNKSDAGAAIGAYESSVQLTGCSISGSAGTAIYTIRSLWTITSSTLSDNVGLGMFINDGTLTITGSTISRNYSGINNEGGAVTTISNSIFSENHGPLPPGYTPTNASALFNNSTLTVVNSTIANNVDGTCAVINTGSLTVIGCTFSGNTMGQAGALVSFSFQAPADARAVLTDCTISGNQGGVGGILNAAMLSLTNDTIVGNHTTGGYGSGGVENTIGTVTVTNTIIAGNDTSGDEDVQGVFNSLGHNLIGNGTGSTGFGASGDLVGTGSSPINPLLGPLQNNGGPTLTHALLTNSPAIDAGDNAVFPGITGPYDQRGIGFSRVVDGDGNGTSTIDIGAYEFQSPNQPPVARAGGPYTVAEGGSVTLDASGTTDPDQPSTTLTYQWDLDGDGIYGETGAAATRGNETGMTPTFSAAGLDGPSSVTVSLRVTDNGGLTSTTTASISITNVNPTVAITGAPVIAPVGVPVTLGSSVSDPGIPDTFTYAWSVTKNGNPFASGTNATLSFTPDANGIYVVTLTVTDDDGGVGTASKTISVQPLTANLWLNLATTDDIGTNFDVLVEALDQNGTAFATGMLDRFQPVRVASAAESVTLTTSRAVTFNPGDPFKLRVSTRIDEGPGHSSGRLQIQFDAVSRSSNLMVNFGNGNRTFYLHENPQETNGVMDLTDNTGDNTVDMITKLASKSGGDPWVPMGTWTAAVSNPLRAVGGQAAGSPLAPPAMGGYGTIDSDQALALLLAPRGMAGTTPLAADRGSRGQTESLPVAQDVFAAPRPGAHSAETPQLALPRSPSTETLDRLFADPLSRGWVDSLEAEPLCKPLA